MPTEREVVTNKALSGAELRKIMLLDFERLLENEGLLSHHIAYGRISYSIRLQMHLDNPMRPESEIDFHSKPIARNLVEVDPSLSVIERIPLADPSDNSVLSATQVDRKIDSPNAERLRTGLPVSVSVRQQDNTRSTQEITYPPDPEAGEGNIEVTDVTEQAAAELGVKLPPTLEADQT